MELNGTFQIRDIAGEYVVLPTGDTALKFGGLISLNDVSRLIWEDLEQKKDKEKILEDILENFDVSRDQALADLDEFLDRMLQHDLLIL